MTVPENFSGTSTWTRSIGSMDDAVDFFGDDFWFGDGQFVSFAPHRFDQDGQVQFASSANADGIIAIGDFFDFEGDIGPFFF